MTTLATARKYTDIVRSLPVCWTIKSQNHSSGTMMSIRMKGIQHKFTHTR